MQSRRSLNSWAFRGAMFARRCLPHVRLFGLFLPRRWRSLFRTILAPNILCWITFFQPMCIDIYWILQTAQRGFELHKIVLLWGVWPHHEPDIPCDMRPRHALNFCEAFCGPRTLATRWKFINSCRSLNSWAVRGANFARRCLPHVSLLKLFLPRRWR